MNTSGAATASTAAGASGPRPSIITRTADPAGADADDPGADADDAGADPELVLLEHPAASAQATAMTAPIGTAFGDLSRFALICSICSLS